MAQVNLHVTPKEYFLIKEIIDRVIFDDTPEVHTHQVDITCLTMDIIACHAKGCELDLQALLGSARNDFYHDVWGIHNHIDRTTGQLTDWFIPRFKKMRSK